MRSTRDDGNELPETGYDDERVIDVFRRQLADNQGLETAFNQYRSRGVNPWTN